MQIRSRAARLSLLSGWISVACLAGVVFLGTVTDELISYDWGDSVDGPLFAIGLVAGLVAFALGLLAVTDDRGRRHGWGGVLLGAPAFVLLCLYVFVAVAFWLSDDSLWF